MLVSLQALLNVAFVNRVVFVLMHFLQNFAVDRAVVVPDPNPLANLRRSLILLAVPSVARDLSEAVAKLRVRHQDVLDQAHCFVGKVACKFVLGVQNLLVEALGVAVLKRQVPAQHRE